MKAVQITSIGRPLEDREVETPTPSRHDALVRVEAAGICHSDAHYQDGTSPAGPFPLTPGHEVAGVVEKTGAAVDEVRPGDRVAIHYLVTCGTCGYCLSGREQFCQAGQMIGKHRNGGYAEMLVVPARNLVPVPDGVDLAHAAVSMCSTATSFHAIRRAGLTPGDTVAVFGAGGLGLSAIQLALLCGASNVVAIDLSPERLSRAAEFGARTVDANAADPVGTARELEPAGFDVTIDLVGIPETVLQATKIAAFGGRVAVVGISNQPAEIDTYADVIGRELVLLGVSDHTKAELVTIIDWLSHDRLDLAGVVTESVPLSASAIEPVLQRRRESGAGFRTVIRPTAAEDST